MDKYGILTINKRVQNGEDNEEVVKQNHLPDIKTEDYVQIITGIYHYRDHTVDSFKHLHDLYLEQKYHGPA